MTRRIIAMMLTLCMAVSLLGGTVSAKTLRDDLSGVQLQKNANEKWTDQELIRMTEQLPGAVAMPADVGDHEIEESEPNNSYSTANPVANDYTVYGAIEGDDVDGFVFTLDSYSEVTIVSACSTGGLLYGILDARTQDVVAESGFLGQDEDTGLYMDGLDVELPAGDYCVVFMDYYEEYLEYMFYLQIVEVTAHEHRYDVTVVEPTCTEGGYSIYTCACGDSYMDDETAALGHSFENSPVIPHEDGKHHCWDCIRCDERRTENCTFTGTVTKEPTQEAEGVKTFTCGVCGNSYTESIPKLDHEHSYTTKVVAPTCTEGGYTEYTCACGHSYKANETAALGHDFEKSAVNPGKDGKHHYWTCSRCDEVKTENCVFTGAVTKEPTEEAEGVKTFTCGVCGNSYTEAIYYSTTFTQVNVVIPSDISAGNYLIYGISSQKTDNGTTSAFMSAEEAKNSRMSASYFTIVDNTVTTTDAYSIWKLIDAPNGGFYIQNAATEKYLYYGNSSGNKILLTDDLTTAGIWNVVAHNDGWTVQEQSSGRQLSCNRFGSEGSYYLGFAAYETDSSTARLLDFYKQNYSNVEHTHNYSAKVVAPTCTEGGYTEYTCACGHSYKANETAALGHDFEKSAVNPGKDGKHHYWTCGRCEAAKTEDCVFTGVVTKEPTTEEDGLKTFTCGVCGNSYTESIPKLEEAKLPRIYGDGRVETSFEVAETLKEVLGISKFKAILIAYGDNFADALAGSYLASQKDAPILLYRPKYQDQIAGYIRENLASGGTVYILGGTAVVPQGMEDALSGLKVRRLAGENRFETNIKILEEGNVTGEEILIATGWNFADCLSASATGLPVLMVNSTTGKLTDGQIEFLEAHADNTYTIIGGTGAVSDSLKTAIEDVTGREVCRVSGDSREETSVKVAETYFDAPEYVLLAYSRNFPDGLCGGPLAHAMNAPLLLVNAGKEAYAAAYIKAIGIESGAILGGEAAVSEATGRIVFGLD